MWSDRPSRERHRKLVDALRPFRPKCELQTGSVSIDQLHEWQAMPGFAMLHHPGLPGKGPVALNEPVATIGYRDHLATVRTGTKSQSFETSAFDLLEAAREAWHGCGAVWAGFLSYDLAAELEDLGTPPDDDIHHTSLRFSLYDMIHEVGGWNPRMVPLESAAGVMGSRPDKAGFEAAVASIVETIHAGDIFQTNLCRRIEASFDADDAWRLYQRLCAINPARYSAFLRLGQDNAVLSASPEQYLRVDGRMVESSPIKGTRPRGADPASDAAMIEELVSSAKDRAELAMIVDVVRNDLGRVCQTGSVEVTGHAQLMTLPTVHHLYSTVVGRLREEATYTGLLRASFPAASISGAPKIEAMHVAQREEKQLRGPTMGAIGWMTDDAMELSVAIRTAFVSEGKARYYAGCGITADSDPVAEYQESYHKAAAFVRALTE